MMAAQFHLADLFEIVAGAVGDRIAILHDGGAITGFIDLVSERAYKYRPGQTSDLIQIPEALKDEQQTARQEMLEHLADYDDHLMEELLEDVQPPKGAAYDDLAKDLADDLIVPVFFGSAETDAGITRLWKALRHEVPAPEVAAISGTLQQMTNRLAYRLSLSSD